MKNYSTSKVFAAACAGMAFFGVTMLSLAPILGPLNESVQGANALPSTMSIGIILGTILFGPVVDKFGYKWLLIIASAPRRLIIAEDKKWFNKDYFLISFTIFSTISS